MRQILMSDSLAVARLVLGPAAGLNAIVLLPVIPVLSINPYANAWPTNLHTTRLLGSRVAPRELRAGSAGFPEFHLHNGLNHSVILCTAAVRLID